MTPWIGMTLGMEKTEKQRIAGLRMTSDRHSNFDCVEEDQMYWMSIWYALYKRYRFDIAI